MGYIWNLHLTVFLKCYKKNKLSAHKSLSFSHVIVLGCEIFVFHKMQNCWDLCYGTCKCVDILTFMSEVAVRTPTDGLKI